MAYKEFTVGNKILKIDYDECPSNPISKEFDEGILGTLAYKHSRYDFTGADVIADPIDWLADKLGLPEVDDYSNDVLQKIEASFFDTANGFVAIPVFMYEHSGVTISSGSFNCRFDSGKLGYFYTSFDRIKELFVIDVVDDEAIERARKNLEVELKVFASYVEGKVFRFEVVKINKCKCCDAITEEQEDSCGGFYGDDFKTNGMADHIPDEFADLL